MAKSKKLHSVQFTGSIEQNNNADTIDSVQLYIDRELSGKYGANVRNGKIWRVTGYSFAVRPKDTGASDDFDLGGNLVGQLKYIPVNKHTLKAWAIGYDMFQRQKRLMGRVGQSTRYDDFEIAYDAGGTDTRTSIIDDNPIAISVGGAGGGDGHRVGFFGDSNDGNNYTSLADVYNSRFPVPGASTSHYGTTIKASKCGNTYIEQSTGDSIWMTAHASSGAGAPSLTGATYHTSTGYADNIMFDGHLPFLTGSLELGLQWNTKDVTSSIEDDLYWSLTLFLEGWTPAPTLAKLKSKNKSRPKTTSRGGRKSSGRKSKR